MNETEFASYADCNTPFVICDSIDGIIKSPENKPIKQCKWFAGNRMKANKDKFHILISNYKNSIINVDRNM